MLQIERVEKIETQVRFPDLKVGDVFTWGAAYDPYIKVNSAQAFQLSSPFGLATIDHSMTLRSCDAKLVVTGLNSQPGKRPNSGI